MTFVYPVGIPFALGWWLFRHRVDLRADEVGRRSNSRITPAADLWGPYRPERYYYEVIECFRRIALTGFAVFIYPDSSAQIAIVLLLAVVFMVVSEILSPFARPVEMWLYRAGHYVVFASMYLALLLRVDVSDEGDQSQGVFAVVVVVAHACMVLVVLGQGLLIFMGWEGKTDKNERQTVFPAPAESRASLATDWSFLGSQGGLLGNEKDGGGGGDGDDDDYGEGRGGEEVSTHNPLYAESNNDGGGRDGGGFGYPRRRHAGAGREDNGHAGVSAGGDAENADEGEEVKGEEVAAPAAKESFFPVSPSGPRRQMPEQQATFMPGSSAAVVARRSNPTGGAQEGHELNVSEDYSVVLSDADFAGTAAADGFSTI
ncbi:hypothetical protein Esi_0257_0026 [Ectocarpus siliculosus]|uniref:TRP C-terminal domain-containing protein n=1 Tax=Ectocarpus siliculosus TaxID=2880 RepID=D7FTU0_ECTSI|nr:hypothetical protein Esi_0257_0026 [Ectocarpus siliculosus]|eukprot:CBJ31467.1 hypothetical protein Esi_0257_0026 [Ectocarpus siliculosus]